MRPTQKVLARRGFLVAAITAPALAGCSGQRRIAIGEREAYTPPPPGIDEIYRTDLLQSVTDFASNLAKTESRGDFPSFLAAALTTHQRALRTGAEQEETASAEAKESSRTTAASAAPGSSSKMPAEKAMAESARSLAALRDLYAQAAIQVSGDFADLCASGAAWAEWAASRLAHRAHEAKIEGVSGPEQFTDAEPSREVPKIDPPEPAEASLIEVPLQRAQEDENFAAYALEVAATRVEKERRDSYVKAARSHAARAEEFGKVSERLGFEPVAREAGYALPRPLDAKKAAEMRIDITSRSLANAVELVGLAPFGERAPFLFAALESAKSLEPLHERLAPFPGIDAGDD